MTTLQRTDLSVCTTSPPTGYSGASGDGTLDLVGFDADVLEDGQLRISLINQRPPVNEQGQYLDATKTSANVSIDVFEHMRGEKTMEDIRTVADPEVYLLCERYSSL